MRFCKYLRSFYPPNRLLGCTLLCILLGLIPAALIHAQSGLVDGGIAGAAGVFVPSLFMYLALLASEALIGNLLLRSTEKHRLRVGTRLDSERLEKANRIAYPLTETREFHELLERSAKAPELEQKCCQAIQTILTHSLRILSVLAVLWTVDVRAVVWVMALLGAGILLNMRLARCSDGFWGKYIENMRRTNYFASMLLQREFAAERKVFAYDQEVSRRFSRSFAKARKENAALGHGRLVIESLLQLFSVLYAMALVLLLLGPLTAGAITVGTFTAVFYGAAGLLGKCSQLCDALLTLTGSFRQMQSHFAFLELEEERQNAAPETVSGAPSIEFVHVSFTYPGAASPVLNDVSFRLEPGRHYALVGENGCGKTTLVKLMCGLYTPTRGQILVDGKPLEEMSREEKNRYFSVVFQDFYRYPLTVRETVSMGRPLPEDTLREAFRALDFHPAALSGEKGLDSDLLPLQKTGAGLSGGEWQKLAIARCVLSPAPVAILDEPNAALDPIAESAVYRAYREMLGSRTTLFISHRLGSVRMADQILVLQEGRVIATDSHRALMEHCSYYAELFNTQRGLYYEN